MHLKCMFNNSEIHLYRPCIRQIAIVKTQKATKMDEVGLDKTGANSVFTCMLNFNGR